MIRIIGFAAALGRSPINGFKKDLTICACSKLSHTHPIKKYRCSTSTATAPLINTFFLILIDLPLK
jgi:hypothetical protein